MGVWDKSVVWGWVAVLLILFGYELWTLLDKNPHTPPLTNLTVRYVPWWVTLSVIGWLFFHFAVRYADPVYMEKLRSTGTAVVHYFWNRKP